MTATEVLQQHNIRPSIQRTIIYTALCSTKSHPSVSMLYSALSPSYPALSKTTIYNTLKIFLEAGLIQELLIDGEETRYDADTSPHIHFMCRRCATVYDVAGTYPQPDVPDGFIIEEIQLFIRGTCASCAQRR